MSSSPRAPSPAPAAGRTEDEKESPDSERRIRALEEELRTAKSTIAKLQRELKDISLNVFNLGNINTELSNKISYLYRILEKPIQKEVKEREKKIKVLQEDNLKLRKEMSSLSCSSTGIPCFNLEVGSNNCCGKCENCKKYIEKKKKFDEIERAISQSK